MSDNLSGINNSLPDSLNRIYSKGDEQALYKHGYLYPVEEVNDFHDPFSELSLFLAKRLKKRILKYNHQKKWSKNIQKTLLEEVLPEFREHFPHYRLGISALKKTWEKIHYYVRHLEKHYAYHQNGKLDISYLIKENLSVFFEKNLHQSHSSFHFAHHITGKISECIAAVDGESIEKSKLTKVIWAMQKQLLPSLQKCNSPYESIDTLDKLIIRLQLEIIIDHPLLSQNELQDKLTQKVNGLLSIKRIKSFRELTPQISGLIATKMYHSSPLHSIYPKDSLKKIENLIKEEYKYNLNSEKKHTASTHLSFSKRFLFVLRLKQSLDREAALEGLKSAIEYIYSLRATNFNINKSVIRKEIFHFLNQEIILYEKKGVKNIKQYILDNILNLFDKMQALPTFPLEKMEMLEIVIWKNLNTHLKLSWKIPIHLINTIEDEISSLFLNHIEMPFPEIIELSIRHLKRITSLSTQNLTQRAHYWSIQNLTLASHLNFSKEHPIFKTILKEMDSLKLNPLSHEDTIKKICTRFLKTHPGLFQWENAIKKRVSLYYLHYYFSYKKEKNETPFDRFQKWHLHTLMYGRQSVFEQLYISELSSITKSLLPYIPFIESYVNELLQLEKGNNISCGYL